MRGRRTVPATHTCPHCGSTKDWWASRKPFGLCSDCRNQRKNLSRDDEYHRRYHFTKTYGITIEERDALILSQGGRCAICDDEDDALHVDHDHATNIVRGMLCGRCNRGLGMFCDDVDRLLAATAYLLRSRAVAA